jgi:FAD/FMN-containing dehydrogenase
MVWRSDPRPFDGLTPPFLAVGMRRSYGDSCLNDGGTVLDATGLDRFIAFDRERGRLRCEAGVTLAAILSLIVPHGWFLPVVPGTRWVTLGGAIANDIHGKNHHHAGTFGAHVERFELLRSCGERLLCSPTEQGELFRATIGGLGLTGLLLWAEIRLRRVPGAHIASQRIRMRGLDEFLELAAADAQHEHTVAWVDCLARGARLGRGFFMRGTPVRAERARSGTSSGRRLSVPFELGRGVVGRWSVATFNALYYRAQVRRVVRTVQPYEPFFFPLDGVDCWNRLYGRNGFVQYQCVVPNGAGAEPLRRILAEVAASGEAPSLAVLKRFGEVPSPWLLSFPRPGLTLAVDFPLRGQMTLALLERLDGLVRDAGGAVYPAKDARMSPASFRSFFPQWERFSQHVDPRFSSSFWRRVHG